MALTEEQIKKIRAELEDCHRPLIFFHDDPDGLASFLLFYRFVGEGKGVVLKTSPEMGESFVKKVDEYQPDKVFILDKPKVSQDFIDKAKCRIVWIDHHEPVKRHNVLYFNPRTNDSKDNQPASYICYQAVQKDMWIAAAGIIGDWVMPDFIDELKEGYNDLLPENIKKPEDILFDSKFGELIRIFSFILKGKNNDAMKCVKVLTRIKEPYEILNQTTAQGKFIYKYYQKIKKNYDALFEDIIKKFNAQKNERILVYIYEDDKMSFTADLSNEFLYRFPDKTILIGREKNGEIKFSFRSAKHVLPPIVEKSLSGVEGYGGGHECACGIVIKKKDYDRFMENLRREME